ncbi:MAG: SdrD B-like domain-containing protein, partial [Bacteroidota bacterium]
EGVEITLTDDDSGEVFTTTTDANGEYIFEDLEPGDYTVTEQPESEIDEDFVDVFDGDESDDGDANDGVLDQDDTIAVTLEPGEDDEDNNFVEEQLGTIGNFVWEDINGNGIQDDGPTGVEGVTVFLLDDEGTRIDQTQTDAAGEYSFIDVEPGDYAVEFVIEEPFEITDQNTNGSAADEDADDSDADETTGLTGTFTLSPGEDEFDIDAGVYEAASLGDTVFVDVNRNGIQDPGEEPLAGVVVLLEGTAGDGEEVTTGTTETTDANGFYEFTDLVPGNYRVQFPLRATVDGQQAALTQEDAETGADDATANDSDANETDGFTDFANLISGEREPDLDAGYALVADVSIVKLVSDPEPNVGDAVVFTIEVRNAGPNDATGVEIQDLIPNGYTNIDNISNGGSLTSDLITWSDINVPNDAIILLTFTAEVEAPLQGVDFDNLAEVTAQDQFDPDSEPGNGDGDDDDLIGSVDTNPNDQRIDPDGEDDADNEPVLPQVADLSLIKTVDTPRPNVGETVRFTIAVTNDGPKDATNVVVEDLLPNGYSGFSLVNAGLTTTSAPSAGATLLTFGTFDVADGETFEIVYDVVVEAPLDGTTYDNVAEITDVDQFDPDSTPDNGDGDDDDLIGSVDTNPNDQSVDPDGEDDADNEPVDPQIADLELVKIVDTPEPQVGERVTFTISVTNDGPDAATGVQITDVVPNGLTEIQALNGGAVDGTAVT